MTIWIDTTNQIAGFPFLIHTCMESATIDLYTYSVFFINININFCQMLNYSLETLIQILV